MSQSENLFAAVAVPTEMLSLSIEEKSARQVKDVMIAIYNNRSDLIITVRTPSSPCEMLNHEMAPLIVSSLIAKNQNYGTLKTPIR